MSQDEKWIEKYNEVIRFIEENKRNPSRHRVEEHLLLNFIKHNRKLKNSNAMKADRLEKFERLLVLIEENKRKNQYM